MILILFCLTRLCSHKNKWLNTITQLTKTGFLFQSLNSHYLNNNQVLTYGVSESIRMSWKLASTAFLGNHLQQTHILKTKWCTEPNKIIVLYISSLVFLIFLKNLFSTYNNAHKTLKALSWMTPFPGERMWKLRWPRAVFIWVHTDAWLKP